MWSQVAAQTRDVPRVSSGNTRAMVIDTDPCHRVAMDPDMIFRSSIGWDFTMASDGGGAGYSQQANSSPPLSLRFRLSLMLKLFHFPSLFLSHESTSLLRPPLSEPHGAAASGSLVSSVCPCGMAVGQCMNIFPLLHWVVWRRQL